MKLYFTLARGSTPSRSAGETLLHRPTVMWYTDGPHCCLSECSMLELLTYLQGAGVPDEVRDRAQNEITEAGRAVLESDRVIEADLKRELERVERDLGKTIIDEASNAARLAGAGFQR
jgi:hypothetical protein